MIVQYAFITDQNVLIKIFNEKVIEKNLSQLKWTLLDVEGETGDLETDDGDDDDKDKGRVFHSHVHSTN